MIGKACLHRFKNLFVVLFAVSILSSCSFQLKEENRDRESPYPGYWGATIQRTQSNATAGAARTTCWNMEGIGYVDIADGRVVARAHGYDLAGFVNFQGKFTSEVKLSKGWQLIFNGQLDAAAGTGQGRLFHVHEVSGLVGCHIRNWSYDEFQGFYFAEPMSIEKYLVISISSL